MGLIMGDTETNPPTFDELVFDSVWVDHTATIQVPSFPHTTPDPYLLWTLRGAGTLVFILLIGTLILMLRYYAYFGWLGIVFFLLMSIREVVMLWPSSLSYIRCEGVMQGRAIGRTWPVPSCFEDQTDSAGFQSHRNFNMEGVCRLVIYTSVAALLCMLVHVVYMQTRKLSTTRYMQLS
jgi:hypothetical protein